MKPLDLQAARTRLDARRHELWARYTRSRELADEEVSSREIEAVEQSTELWDAHQLSVIGEADRGQLEVVIAAIRRIDAGAYGRCAGCGEAIDPRRLDAVPETDRCIGCAEVARSGSSA